MATDALRLQVAGKWQDCFKRLNREEPGISGLMSFSQAWGIATAYVRPKDIKDSSVLAQQPSLSSVRAAFSIVHQCRRLPVLLETFLDDVKSSFHMIEYEIREYMARYETTKDVELIRMLVSRLLDWYKGWCPRTELGSTISTAYTLTFQTHLFSALPPSFAEGFKALCKWSLSPSPSPSLSSPSSSASPSPSKVASTPQIIQEMFGEFEELGLIDRYESVIASVGYEHIEAHVLETCTGQWGSTMLDVLRSWMSDKVVPWMLVIYARGAATAEEARSMLQGVGSRFDFHINKTLCDLRTREIFDIIIDFPDSMGALNDLKDCLQRVDQRTALVTALRKANRKRLLHPGADTKLILSQYVATIKCLRIVDPPGVLLFKVADPIRRYLSLSYLTETDQTPSDASSPTSSGTTRTAATHSWKNEPIVPLQQVMDSVDDYGDPNWEPEPVDAGPDFRTNKPSDVISTLVSIYDSKDLFVKELQVLLAQRLLAIKDGNFERVEKERRNIEILKIRFGEAALQVCEVMLKDMTDSKRIDGHVQSQKASNVHPTIISKHFWPALESSDMVMPGQFQQLQDLYSQEFSIFKPDKKLKWLPHLGTVRLELQLDDRTVEADVPPLEAAFIEMFSNKDKWTLEELITEVGDIDRSAAFKALVTWVNMGVLKEDPENTFVLLERAEEDVSGKRSPEEWGVSAGPELPPVITAQQQQAEQMKVYWKFIEGMLTNLGSLPLDRIQTMLKFAPGYDQSIEQLATFMEAARREGLVVVRDGMWRLNN